MREEISENEVHWKMDRKFNLNQPRMFLTRKDAIKHMAIDYTRCSVVISC